MHVRFFVFFACHRNGDDKEKDAHHSNHQDEEHIAETQCARDDDADKKKNKQHIGDKFVPLLLQTGLVPHDNRNDASYDVDNNPPNYSE